MVSINNIPNSFKNGARKFITKMTDPDALAPVILLEAAVTAGRTYQAYQRGGFDEARERGTEETLGAIFWLGGVSAFNKLGDMAGRLVKLESDARALVKKLGAIESLEKRLDDLQAIKGVPPAKSLPSNAGGQEFPPRSCAFVEQ